MKIVLIVAALMLVACGPKEAETRVQVNQRFVVEKLFTNDGCAVYRFADNDRYHYYTDCRGATTSSWTENCGKNCRRVVEEEVETAR